MNRTSSNGFRNERSHSRVCGGLQSLWGARRTSPNPPKTAQKPPHIPCAGSGRLVSGGAIPWPGNCRRDAFQRFPTVSDGFLWVYGAWEGVTGLHNRPATVQNDRKLLSIHLPASSVPARQRSALAAGKVLCGRLPTISNALQRFSGIILQRCGAWECVTSIRPARTQPPEINGRGVEPPLGGTNPPLPPLILRGLARGGSSGVLKGGAGVKRKEGKREREEAREVREGARSAWGQREGVREGRGGRRKEFKCCLSVYLCKMNPMTRTIPVRPGGTNPPLVARTPP
jgi:hypothetical protein